MYFCFLFTLFSFISEINATFTLSLKSFFPYETKGHIKSWCKNLFLQNLILQPDTPCKTLSKKSKKLPILVIMSLLELTFFVQNIYYVQSAYYILSKKLITTIIQFFDSQGNILKFKPYLFILFQKLLTKNFSDFFETSYDFLVTF